jgi:hypothetical protein
VTDRLQRAGPLVIVVAAFVAYRSALFAYFYDDDFQWLVSSLSFTPVRLVDILSPIHFYRPVIDLYFAVATPLFGASPTLFHAANIVLHAVNALLLLALARRLSGSGAYGFLAALFFVVQPAPVDTIAWISALAEAIGAAFGCLAILAFLQFRRSGALAWYALSLVSFLLTLLTHESSVVFFPLIGLADWASNAPRSSAAPTWTWRSAFGPYIPHAIMLVGYLAIDLFINSRNYLVSEGHYSVGLHVLINVRDYLVALYAGKGNAVNYLFLLLVFIAVVLSRSRRAWLATAWIFIALVPFVFFTWGTSFRYLYLPAMGFSMLMADGVLYFDRLLASRVPNAVRATVVVLVATVAAGRFTIFAAKNVRNFAEHTEAYRRYVAVFRETRMGPVEHDRVPADPDGLKLFGPKFLEAVMQWEYRNPNIRLIDEPANPHP